MKKLIFYIMMFSISILLGYFTLVSFSNKNAIPKNKKVNPVASANPVEERPTDYIQDAASMLGKTLIVNGIVKEAYKNKKNEVVIYIKDRKFPFILNCTLYNSEFQIKHPLKLGESISIRGKFTELSEEMHFEKCKILYRSTN